MRVRDMNATQLKRYVEDNYTIEGFLELLSAREMMDAISKNEDINEDYTDE